MGYEIDFLAVGEGTRSGDAIALRYGNLHGSRNEQTVVIIDGGTKEAGGRLVQHVKSYYDTDRVDFVFLTHPDGDHASGLSEVIEGLTVDRLVMHRPWEHAEEIRSLFHDGRITDASLEARIRASLQAAHDLEAAALDADVDVVEGFEGAATNDGVIRILGPSRDYFQSLIPQFRRTPDAAKMQDASFFKKAVEFVKKVFESMQVETLDDGGETSAENNSSMILLFLIDGQQILFTGDAGIPALTAAADYADSQNIILSGLRLLHVPHHGSKRNVGPTVLNRIKAREAMISAAAGGEPKHPAKKVINALTRRGMAVMSTQGSSICIRNDAPARPGWTGGVTPHPFYSEVEE